jgi:hypothetical protein
MKLRISRGLALSACIAFATAVSNFSIALAADLPDDEVIDSNEAHAGAVPIDARAGGVLQESFQYHRQGYGATNLVSPYGPHSTNSPAGGWYGYGFPVQTYRWGWFGAGRYYPRVVWHRGYYDDCCRWAYRQGY